VGSGSVGSNHQTVSGASKKNSFTFYFWHKPFGPFVIDDVKIAELSNDSFEGKNATFLGVVKSDLSYIFSGVKTPQPRGSIRPCITLLRVGSQMLFKMRSSVSNVCTDTRVRTLLNSRKWQSKEVRARDLTFLSNRAPTFVNPAMRTPPKMSPKFLNFFELIVLVKTIVPYCLQIPPCVLMCIVHSVCIFVFTAGVCNVM